MKASDTRPTSKRSTDRWENEGGLAHSPGPASSELQSEMQRYGVTPVELTVFDWGGYRYSNARDAIAAAKRAAIQSATSAA